MDKENEISGSLDCVFKVPMDPNSIKSQEKFFFYRIVNLTVTSPWNDISKPYRYNINLCNILLGEWYFYQETRLLLSWKHELIWKRRYLFENIDITLETLILNLETSFSLQNHYEFGDTIIYLETLLLIWKWNFVSNIIRMFLSSK